MNPCLKASQCLLIAALLGAASLSACAQSTAPKAADKPAIKPASDANATAGTPKDRARAAITKLNPKVEIDQIKQAPLPGFQEAIVGGQVVYVSNDGKYVIQGTLYDIDAKKDLSEASMTQVRKRLLDTIPASDRIVFAPQKSRYTVIVFTDVECGYCRKLHSQIADYNRLGIEVQYLAFPRMGLGSEDFRKMVAVWCADDRRQALTAAKNDRPITMKTCTNPVTMQYDLGRRMGLAGTPMILGTDGTEIAGYLPPAELLAALQELAGEAIPVAAADGA